MQGADGGEGAEGGEEEEEAEEEEEEGGGNDGVAASTGEVLTLQLAPYDRSELLVTVGGSSYAARKVGGDPWVGMDGRVSGMACVVLGACAESPSMGHNTSSAASNGMAHTWAWHALGHALALDEDMVAL